MPFGALMSKDQFEPFADFAGAPHDMSRLYLSIMAFPERGAGIPSGEGAQFFESFHDFYLWSVSKNYGKPSLKGQIVPTKRQVELKLGRGIARIKRRISIYDYYTSKVYRENIEGRSVPLSKIDEVTLNRLIFRTQVNFGKSDLYYREDKDDALRDFRKRVYNPSIHVLPLVHGIYQHFIKYHYKYKPRNFLVLLMLMYHESDTWIYDAIERSIDFRKSFLIGAGCNSTMPNFITPRQKSAQ